MLARCQWARGPVQFSMSGRCFYVLVGRTTKGRGCAGAVQWTASLLRVGHVFWGGTLAMRRCVPFWHADDREEEVGRSSDVSTSPCGIESVLGDGGFVHGE